MKKLMNWIMLSCKKATELIEKRTESGLSARERIQLRLHKSMCDACSNYEQHSHHLNHYLKSHLNDTSFIAEKEKNDLLKNTIINKLK